LRDSLHHDGRSLGEARYFHSRKKIPKLDGLQAKDRPLRSIAPILPRLPRLKIVDVGAAATADGPVYLRLMRALPCDVVGFEPVTTECDRLNALHLPGHLYLPYAIADGEPRQFYECSSPDTSSLFEPDSALAGKFHSLDEPLRVVSSRRIETRRLDDLAETAGVDFLKLDVQGAELLVLQGAAERLRDVLIVHTEVEFLPLYKGQPLFADIDGFLRARGFAFHTMTPFGRSFKPLLVNNSIYASLNQLIWADAIYVRDFMGFMDLPPQSLLKLAAILHQNYGSFDLAALALNAYDRQTGSSLQTKYLALLSAS
jgi:FkbM family methyltransferase